MKTVRLLSLAFATSSFGPSGWAAQPDQHAGHYPACAASAPVSKPMPDKASADMAKMDTQTKAMQFMHDKAMNAALLTGGVVAVMAWFVAGALSLALIAGAMALLFTLISGGIGGRHMGGYYGGMGRGGGGGSSGRW